MLRLHSCFIFDLTKNGEKACRSPCSQTLLWHQHSTCRGTGQTFHISHWKWKGRSSVNIRGNGLAVYVTLDVMPNRRIPAMVASTTNRRCARAREEKSGEIMVQGQDGRQQRGCGWSLKLQKLKKWWLLL